MPTDVIDTECSECWSDVSNEVSLLSKDPTSFGGGSVVLSRYSVWITRCCVECEAAMSLYYDVAWFEVTCHSNCSLDSSPATVCASVCGDGYGEASRKSECCKCGVGRLGRLWVGVVWALVVGDWIYCGVGCVGVYYGSELD